MYKIAVLLLLTAPNLIQGDRTIFDGCPAVGDEYGICGDTDTGRGVVRCCSGDDDGTSCSTYELGCHSDKTFSEAMDICTSNGMRLCTTLELYSGVCCGTGCGFDTKLAWTSDDCSGELWEPQCLGMCYYDPDQSCQCDELCTEYDDCCEDYQWYCAGPRCDWGTQDQNCCTPIHKCSHGQGGCHSDFDCIPGTYCKPGSCEKFPNTYWPSADYHCCVGYAFDKCDAEWAYSTGEEDCCKHRGPCDVGEGDCDDDSECEGVMQCESNNCPVYHWEWPNSDYDCCILPTWEEDATKTNNTGVFDSIPTSDAFQTSAGGFDSRPTSDAFQTSAGGFDSIPTSDTFQTSGAGFQSRPASDTLELRDSNVYTMDTFGNLTWGFAGVGFGIVLGLVVFKVAERRKGFTEIPAVSKA